MALRGAPATHALNEGEGPQNPTLRYKNELVDCHAPAHVPNVGRDLASAMTSRREQGTNGSGTIKRDYGIRQ